ncbi:MAG: hypothetical protein E7624_03845 [Ruminococcaceae bacterium]|nr:hypothetical protein [Oscillospiraceae bacterium]
MKNTKTWVKVLLLAFCLVFVFSSLIACGTDEKIANLQQQLDDLKNKGDETATDLDASEAVIAELKTLLDAVKKTADAAATAAKLEEAVAALTAADTTNAAALTAAEAAIKNLIADNATADAATKAALEAADAEIKALAEAAATKTEFNEAVKTLNDTLATKKALEEADAALKKLIADGDAEAAKKLAELKATVDEEVAAKIKAVEDAIKANGENDTKVQTALEAADKAIAERVTALEGTMTEVQKTLTALGEKDAALEARINTILDTKADKETVEAAIEAVKAQINEDIATKLSALQTDVANFKTEVNEKITALQTEQAAIAERVTALESKTTALETTLEAVKTALAAIEEEDFAGNYDAATKELREGEYSLAAFEEKVNAVDKALYTDEDYAKFVKKADDIRFFLTRAISVQQIKDYFEMLDEAVAEMPTLVESLKAEIESIYANKSINLTVAEDGATCLTKLTGIYNKIQDKTVLDTEKVTVNEAETSLAQAYNTIVAAYDNLYAAVNGYTAPEGAEDTKTDAVEATATLNAVVLDGTVGILYKQSDASVAEARAAFNKFAADFFTNTAYTVLYSEDCNEASEVFAGYETLTTYEARVAQLKQAASVKPALSEDAYDYLTFETTRPLFSDFEVLNTFVNTTIANWRANAEGGFNIDDVNYQLIFTSTYTETIPNEEDPEAEPDTREVTVYEYDLLAKSYDYASAMKRIYDRYVLVIEVTDLETGETAVAFDLVTLMTELCAKEKVLYTDLALVQGETSYRAKLDEIKALIVAVENYNEEACGNYEAMIGTELLAKFAKVEETMEVLVNAELAIEALTAEMNAMVGKVTFGDYDTIVGYANTIKTICERAHIEMNENDPNYVSLIADAQALQKGLYEEYLELTAEVARIYLIVEGIMDGKTWKLSDGKDVNTIDDHLAEIVLRLGVDNIDLDLTLVYNAGEENEYTEETNLKTLWLNWNSVAAQYTKLAADAQADAEAVNAAINALATLSTDDVKNNAQIVEAWNLFTTWATKYLGLDMTTATDDEIAAAVKAVQGVKVIGEVDTLYVFVSEENFAALNAKYDASMAQLAAAADKWTEVSAQMNALITEWNIHSDFATVLAAYNAYVADFYSGSIAADTQLNEEYDLYTTFAGVMSTYEDTLDDAKAAAAAIKNAINALPAVTTANAAEVIAKVAEIRDLVADYEDTYRCAILTPCTQCGITADEVLALEKADAKSAYTKACADFIAANGLTEDTAVKASDVNFALAAANGQLNRATTADQVKDAKGIVESTLAEYQAILDAANATPAP